MHRSFFNGLIQKIKKIEGHILVTDENYKEYEGAADYQPSSGLQTIDHKEYIAMKKVASLYRLDMKKWKALKSENIDAKWNFAVPAYIYLNYIKININ